MHHVTGGDFTRKHRSFTRTCLRTRIEANGFSLITKLMSIPLLKHTLVARWPLDIWRQISTTLQFFRIFHVTSNNHFPEKVLDEVTSYFCVIFKVSKLTLYRPRLAPERCSFYRASLRPCRTGKYKWTRAMILLVYCLVRSSYPMRCRTQRRSSMENRIFYVCTCVPCVTLHNRCAFLARPPPPPPSPSSPMTSLL